MLGFPIGLLYANAGEWFIHKHVLHGRGRRRESFWSFHFHEHHRAARQHGFRDADYERPAWGWHAQGREVFGVAGLMVAHLPLLPVAPFFTLAVWYSGWRYHRVHKRSHLDPDWARKHLPWHYDHHMGPDQHANWCVTRPWFDHVMGTRVPYLGTERERRDRARRRARQQAAAGAPGAGGPAIPGGNPSGRPGVVGNGGNDPGRVC